MQELNGNITEVPVMDTILISGSSAVPSFRTLGALSGAGVVVIPLAAFLFYCYQSWKRLAHVPGPPTASFSILWLLRHAWGGNLFPCMIEAGDEYGKLLLSARYRHRRTQTDLTWLQGPLVRIGPNLLLCSDPDEVRRISGVRSEYTKGPAYDAGCITEGEPHVASQRDPSKHKVLRSKMGTAVSDFRPPPSLDPGSTTGLLTVMHAVLSQRGTGRGSSGG